MLICYNFPSPLTYTIYNIKIKRQIIIIIIIILNNCIKDINNSKNKKAFIKAKESAYKNKGLKILNLIKR